MGVQQGVATGMQWGAGTGLYGVTTEVVAECRCNGTGWITVLMLDLGLDMSETDAMKEALENKDKEEKEEDDKERKTNADSEAEEEEKDDESETPCRVWQDTH